MLMATTINSSINEKPGLHFLAALTSVIECLVRRRALPKLSPAKLPSVIIKVSYDRHGGGANERTPRTFTKEKKQKLSFFGLAVLVMAGSKRGKRTTSPQTLTYWCPILINEIDFPH